MTYTEAEVVRQMIDGHWNMHMDSSTGELWLSVLLPEDAAEATAVVAHMARRMHYAPKIVDFKEVMRLSFPKELPATPLPAQTDMPPWVKIQQEARAAEDYRHFAEQIPGMAELDDMYDDGFYAVPSQPLTDKSVWVQIGEYGYEGCAYDFAGPTSVNRLCAMHPHLPTRQPLKQTEIGKHTFMLCMDCRTRYFSRVEERTPVALR